MTTLQPGLALTLWHGSGLRDAWSGAEALLRDSRPQIVQLHAGPEELRLHAAEVAGHVRAALPGVRLWLGVGMDGFPRRLGLGRERLVAEAVGIARLARDLRAEHLVLDAEAAWKSDDPEERERETALASGVVEAIARDVPEVVLGHTAYDQPGLHGSYAWRAWLGGPGVRYTWPQVYAATGGETMAHRGALPRRERASLESYAAAVRKLGVRPDVADSDPASLEWRPYVQLHGVPYPDTISLGVKYRLCAGWAAPSRLDDDGRTAVRALAELYRRGHHGPEGVRDFQRAAGITPDGICGPKTLGALLGAVAQAPQAEYGTGEAVLARALSQLGDPYYYGARPRGDNADPKAFDCSALATWACLQGAGVLAGTSRNNTSDPRTADASSGDWVAQARSGVLERIAPELAARIPGAVYARAPRVRGGKRVDGHVAISDGAGLLVEAKGGAGVIHSRRWDADTWDLACLVPGVRYVRP